MAILRWEPRGLTDLRGEIDRLFDSFGRREGPGEPASLAAWRPTADVAERHDVYVVTSDVPGVDREDIKVRLTNNVLTISGEKKAEREEKKEKENYHLIERSYGSFSRSFHLPTDVQEGKISAEFKDGVLTVTLPKAEKAKAKEIEVK